MRERSGAWDLRVYAAVTPSPDASAIWPERFGAASERSQRVLAALVVEAAETGAPRQGTVGELMDEWLSHAERDFSPKTALETRRFIERAVKPTIAQSLQRTQGDSHPPRRGPAIAFSDPEPHRAMVTGVSTDRVVAYAREVFRPPGAACSLGLDDHIADLGGVRTPRWDTPVRRWRWLRHGGAMTPRAFNLEGPVVIAHQEPAVVAEAQAGADVL